LGEPLSEPGALAEKKPVYGQVVGDIGGQGFSVPASFGKSVQSACEEKGEEKQKFCHAMRFLGSRDPVARQIYVLFFYENLPQFCPIIAISASLKSPLGHPHREIPSFPGSASLLFVSGGRRTSLRYGAGARPDGGVEAHEPGAAEGV
jgi:hypothetical protein